VQFCKPGARTRRGGPQRGMTIPGSRMKTSYDQIAGWCGERLAALSDGVFAGHPASADNLTTRDALAMV